MSHHHREVINLWNGANRVRYNLEKDLFCLASILSHSSNNFLKLKPIICFFITITKIVS